MTFHIIPWMWGVDGDKTCGISDTIYITDDGCESFFTLEKNFTVKPDQGPPQLVYMDDSKKSGEASSSKNTGTSSTKKSTEKQQENTAAS
jgi:Xaa-Pro dipeptidase